MIIRLLNKDNIDNLIEKSKSSLSDYRYFVSDEKDSLFDRTPSAISFDDETSEYLVSFEKEQVRVKKNCFDNAKLNDLPLLLDNFFANDVLDFLTLAIRDSKKCARDNHIYLYYDEPATFYLMLCLNDLDKLLESEKYVFLLGKDTKQEYPIDFKEKFDIDYSSMQPQLLAPDELFRICYFSKGTFSGADFITNVIARSEDVILVRLWSLHNATTILGEPLDKSKKYSEIVNDTEREYVTSKVISFFRNNKDEICFSWSGDDNEMKKYPGADIFIDFLEKLLLNQTVTSLDIFKAYFITKDFFCNKEKAYNYRVVPCLLFEPHMGGSDAYFNLFKSFEYKIQMSGFRDPLKRLASGFRRKDVPPYGLNLPLSYSITEDADYLAIKFEDLKLYPEIICKDICRSLHIRYTAKMLDLDYSEKSTFGNKVVKGYDIQPVIRPIDDVLGIFDQMRLRYFFKESTDYFEYPVFFGDELSDTEAESLFMIPFTIFYNLDPEVTKEGSVKIVKELRKKLIDNYIKMVNDKRVRRIDRRRMPYYIKNESIDSYKGAISFNNENYLYNEETESMFNVLDGFLIFFAKNQDMKSFNDKADIQIIEKNILKLMNIYFEQKQLFNGNDLLKQLLYDLTNMRITLDKIEKDNNRK